MADYNLSGLNPRDFEHMTQALALKAIGPGVLPFGDGPDGGREATFTGRSAYPSIGDPWDGYIVLQCKFLQRPSGNTRQDGAWALRELREDLAEYEDPERDLERPDYYIFVTNVVLTPASRRGTKDRLLRELKGYAQRLGWRDYAVWDHDALCRMLDADDSVRSRYSPFISAGDVLANAMRLLNGQRPDFDRVMTAFLQRELRKDQFVKLEQAGHSADQKTALAHVFVDLPAGRSMGGDGADVLPMEVVDQFEKARGDSTANAGRPRPGVVAEILKVGRRVLRGNFRGAAPSTQQPDGGKETAPRPSPDRFVLVGGPGQGKSTVGQFICQVYRAAILDRRPPNLVTDEARSVISAVKVQAESAGLAVRGVARFPVRVVLDEFATALARDEATSLIGYLAARIRQLTDYDVSIGDLRRWLGAYPWLLVLDGLDEVPATSNRHQVLEKVTDFWDEVAAEDADVLVVATTRPQGYSAEFPPDRFAHRYLTPLSASHAMHYARRLADAKYGADPDRRETVLRRLEAALKHEATARLMRSPLQVTIMATLVDRIGHPPEERWRLFSDYYNVVYQRETEREFDTSRVLRQRRVDVDAIHRRVGLLLQTESERAGGTDARLSVDGFRRLVRERIAEGGHDGEALETRTAEIANAALYRLVFLVGLEEDRIGFEIRSLQEFTAAEALMQGSDQQVSARLEAIAPIAHWRNVFLFAAGKCFAEREHLRESILLLCERLNDPAADSLAAATLTGARLALDLLEEGIARELPLYARMLARRALRLVESHDTTACDRLAQAYSDDLELVFREALEMRLRDTEVERTLGAWRVLAALVDRGITWAEGVADAHWPAAAGAQLRIVEFCRGVLQGRWGLMRRLAVAAHALPWNVDDLDLPPAEMASQILGELAELPSWYPGLEWIAESTPKSGAIIAQWRPDPMADPVATFEIRRVADRAQDVATLRDFPFTNRAWAPLVAAARFATDPTPTGLADALRWLADCGTAGFVQLLRYPLAWPLAGCLRLNYTANQLRELADRAECGALGTPEAWTEAERRWVRTGVTGADWERAAAQWPFDECVGEVGFPFTAARVIYQHQAPVALWEAAITQYRSLPTGIAKSEAAELVCGALDSRAVRSAIKPALTAGECRTLLAARSWPAVSYDMLDLLGLSAPLDPSWIELFEWLGQPRPKRSIIASRSIPWAADLARAYVDDPSRTGLLDPLSTLALSGSPCRIPVDVLRSVLDGCSGPADDNEDAAQCRAQQRFNAVLLRLAQGGWDAHEADVLASELATAASDFHNAVELTTKLLEHHQPPPDEMTVFALALRGAITCTGARGLGPIEDELNALARRRTSGLGDSERWRSLGLPVVAAE